MIPVLHFDVLQKSNLFGFQEKQKLVIKFGTKRLRKVEYVVMFNNSYL